MLSKLEGLFNEFNSGLKNCGKEADVLNLKSLYLGKKGQISQILKGLKNASPVERKEIGQKSNYQNMKTLHLK